MIFQQIFSFKPLKNITGTNTDYKIYYGESGAVNPPSKADNTFLIYENCSSTGDWVAGSSGITTSGGICSLSGAGYAHKEFNTGYVSLNGSMVSYTAEASAYILMILSPELVEEHGI